MTPRGERPTRQRPFFPLSFPLSSRTHYHPASTALGASLHLHLASHERAGLRGHLYRNTGPRENCPSASPRVWSVRQRTARPTHLRPGWRVRPPVRPALVGRPARGNAELLLLLHSACVGERPGGRAAQACADVDVCVRVCKCECCVFTRASGEGGLQDHRFPAPPIIPAHVYQPPSPPPPPRCTACPGSRVQDLPPRLV